ncbi:MAG TPA: hypothetical protein VGU03_00995 [Frateuria sp.]|uniref:hypothetical protein n=1 Tax=Frateuria sp. TaxID=2211372 RepID=UPI002DEFF74D|nr:hypothetical protein [Frateuria sp.]
MQVELTEGYGLRMAHILATGATSRLHRNTSNAASAHGYADPEGAAEPASRQELGLVPAGRGAAGEVERAYADHCQTLAVLLDVDTIPAARRRGPRRSVEGISAAPRAFASYHPAARRSS